MAELLHMALVDLGRGGEAGAQGVARKFLRPLALGKIAANLGRHGRLLDEAGDLLVWETIWSNVLAFAGDPAKERAVGQLCELDPGLDRDQRAP